jgi:CDP-diglyceride synthetase
MYEYIFRTLADTPIVLENILPNPTGGSNSEIKTILGIIYGVVGALAVLFIVISGFRYIVSDGDPQKAAQAKQGIIYALIGIVVVIMAQVITVFVIGKVG